MDDWRQLLAQALDRAGSIQAVADQMGVSRTYVSLVARDKLARVSPNFVSRVLATYYVVICPATGLEQPRSRCAEIALASAPTHNPAAMRIWKTCQHCPHRPGLEEQ